MKYIYKTCGCELETFQMILIPPRHKVKACPIHGTRIAGRVYNCIDCGVEVRTSLHSGKSLRCKPDALKTRRAQTKLYKQNVYGLNPPGVTKKPPAYLEYKSTRIGTDAATNSRGDLLTSLLPNPVIRNPYQSPCTQGCSVFPTLGTYDNTACSSCVYRWSYAGMPYTQPAPEYTYEVRL
jgi:hypothetical protein